MSAKHTRIQQVETVTALRYTGAMETLTRTDALSRASSIKANEIDVLLDLRGARTEEKTFRSQSTLRFTTSSAQTFVDLIADSVTKVEVNGAPADFEVSDTRVTLRNLPVNEEITVVIDAQCNYSTTGEGLHRYRDPEDDQTYLYTQLEPTDARRVYACFDQPGIKSAWQFSVIAPSDWTVLSNQVVESREPVVDDIDQWKFERTQPLSSYITAVVAGPYAHVDGGTWEGGASDGRSAQIALGVYCRKSLADYLDADDIFEVTRAGLGFFHNHYGYTYPWGKYDQVFVPEYNLGAMENPGCVTFNESLIYRDTPTRSARQHRANIIFHEMCHMWFGDLVTPNWWDDLWLKESFADNQGSWGLVEATEFTDEWATFASGRKEWAYLQDQLPTTHPIVADIPDVEAAKHNFDGITYAKGAAVLKQLVAYVGAESFFEGARRYFQDHQWSATSLQDFLQALEAASPRDDLDEWQQAWLHTARPSKLSVSQADGHCTVSQECIDPATGESQLRPHRINIGFYKLEDGLKRVGTAEVTLRDHEMKVDYPQGFEGAAFDLIIPNDDDLTYAVVELDDSSLEVAVEHVGSMESATSRAVVWSALWAAVRDAKLNPSVYVDAVSKHAVSESDDAVAGDLISNALHAMTYFMPMETRKQAATEFVRGAIHAISMSESADRKRQWAAAAISAMIMTGAPDDDQSQFLEDISTKNSALLDVGPTLAWRARVALAARGELDDTQLKAFLEEDNSGEAEVFALRAQAARPDRISRHRFWTQVLEGDLANNKVSAILQGLQDGALGNQVLGFAGDFFDLVLPYWEDHTIGMGNRFVSGAYPGIIDATKPQDAGALRFMATHWLTEYDYAPDALRRLMLEHEDELERRYRIQKKWLDQ